MKNFLSTLINRNINKLFNFLRSIINSHPYFWYFGWLLIPHFKFLLPHDKSYKGFLKLSNHSGLFLDVGANNGISALGFNALLPNYAIFSVEANPQHFSTLTKVNRKIKNFKFIIAAAGDTKTSLSLNIAKYKNIPLHTAASVNSGYINSAFKNNYSKSVIECITWDSVKVDVIPLDELNLMPDFIKIDVEGFDYEVLVGLKLTIRKCRPTLLIEFSNYLYEKYQLFCADFNYTMCLYLIDRDCFINFSDYIEKSQFAKNIPLNVYFIPNETYTKL